MRAYHAPNGDSSHGYGGANKKETVDGQQTPLQRTTRYGHYLLNFPLAEVRLLINSSVEAAPIRLTTKLSVTKPALNDLGTIWPSHCRKSWSTTSLSVTFGDAIVWIASTRCKGVKNKSLLIVGGGRVIREMPSNYPRQCHPDGSVADAY